MFWIQLGTFVLFNLLILAARHPAAPDRAGAVSRTSQHQGPGRPGSRCECSATGRGSRSGGPHIGLQYTVANCPESVDSDATAMKLIYL